MPLTTYPLKWPDHFPRSTRRDPSRFNVSLVSALANVQLSLSRFSRDSHKHIENIIISSNMKTHDDYPRDSGVAIWFEWDGLGVCIPIDRYHFVAHNLQAIHHIIESKRCELRHGTLALVRASFKGFLLAAPTSPPWWQVLEVSERASIEDIRAAWRRKVAIHHPDRAGENDMILQINAAWQQAQVL